MVPESVPAQAVEIAGGEDEYRILKQLAEKAVVTGALSGEFIGAAQMEMERRDRSGRLRGLTLTETDLETDLETEVVGVANGLSTLLWEGNARVYGVVRLSNRIGGDRGKILVLARAIVGDLLHEKAKKSG